LNLSIPPAEQLDIFIERIPDLKKLSKKMDFEIKRTEKLVSDHKKYPGIGTNSYKNAVENLNYMYEVQKELNDRIKIMKTIVKNPSRTATRSSSTRTEGGKYLHRPKVVTNKQTLTTTKSGNTYKFNPNDYDYYYSRLSESLPVDEYGFNLKVISSSSGANGGKWINVNKTSIDALNDFFDKYVLKSKKSKTKFNPADKFIISFLKQFKEPGSYSVTLTSTDINKINKIIGR
jgi:hypothetical protein